jgi:flavin-dependent thymidylate synthase
MKVVLAGYNLDREVIEELKSRAPGREDVTPETLSAAYARISRDPRPADELRAAARQEVERARRSNQVIIFKMGHHSVAEHAVFNFDLIGVSRLALEEIEKFRLCSYTEKSQRYIVLGDDFVIPEEVRKAGLEDLFLRTIRTQNALYHKLYKRLRPHVWAKHKDISGNPRNQAVLEGWAKEDARYIVSLATQGQVGLTLNARNLELMVRRFASAKLAEVRELKARIFTLAKEVAPSVILFTEATEYDAETSDALAATAGSLSWPDQAAGEPVDSSRKAAASKGGVFPGPEGEKAVHLVDFTPDADDRILAALLHSSTKRPYEKCLAQARRLTEPQKGEFIQTALQRMEFFDFPPREFEYADLTFSLVLSASCFAQLKRHRMATLTSQSYDPSLGVTVPPSLDEVGARDEFMAVIDQTAEAFAALGREIGEAAAYVLTNSHRRRVLLKVNVRELYHISRLRQDPTAQWDIRNVAAEMASLAKEALPLAGLLLGGKNEYPALYRKIYGRFPRFSPPTQFK